MYLLPWLPMKPLLTLALCLLSGIATAQTTPLVIGQVQTLHSEQLHEDRSLNIYLPEGYDSAKAYPVIYLLDGSRSEDFLHVVGLTQFFSMTFGMPDCIVVGIANVDRRRDFTFHTDRADLKKEFPTAGHSDAFIAFLEKELLPFISARYKTTETHYIIGQSLGGLLATEVLLKHPQLFTHYLIVSPSLWWDEESMAKAAPALVRKAELAGRFVYVSVGAEGPIMERDAKGLVQALRQAGKPGLRVHFVPMLKENHATILHLSLYEAYKILFPLKG